MPGDQVSLKEHFEAQLRCLKELLDVQAEAISKALDLQAREYARRLDDLNHAHRQAREILVTYVPRDMYEERHKLVESRLGNLEEWRAGADATAKAVKALADEKLTEAVRRFTYITVVAGIVISVVALALNYLLKH